MVPVTSEATVKATSRKNGILGKAFTESYKKFPLRARKVTSSNMTHLAPRHVWTSHFADTDMPDPEVGGVL